MLSLYPECDWTNSQCFTFDKAEKSRPFQLFSTDYQNLVFNVMYLLTQSLLLIF